MRRHQVLLVAAVFMLAGVACSSDSSEPAGGAQTSVSEPTDSTSTPAAAAGSSRSWTSPSTRPTSWPVRGARSR